MEMQENYIPFLFEEDTLFTISDSEESDDGLRDNNSDSDNDSDSDDSVPPISGSSFKWRDDPFIPHIHSFDPTDSGVQYEIDVDAREIDFFKKYVDADIVSIIVEETNRQFKFLTRNDENLTYRTKHWVDCDSDDIYIFLAICMLMTRNSRNTIFEHWSTDELFYCPIYSDTMTRNRFQLILRMLNFADNDEQAPADRQHNIRRIVQEFRKKFSSSFYPSQNICIEESRLFFKGRLAFYQDKQSKVSRFGIQLFVLCDCKSGSIIDFVVHTGSTTEYTKMDGLGVSGNIIMYLMEPYLEKGHSLYIGNFHSSPMLFHILHNKETNVCGTVKKNRAGMPKLDQPLKKGESKSFHTDTVLAQIWKNKRVSSMLSTLHTSDFQTTNKINPKSKQPHKKPSCVIDYSKNVGAVDRTNMMLAYVESISKTMKWYKKLFFRLVDFSLFNAHAAYIHKTKKIVPFGQFQLEVIRQLICEHKKAGNRSISRKRKSIEFPNRLTAKDGHFVMLLTTKAGTCARNRCVVCMNTQLREKKRVDTKYGCRQCSVALCVMPCFEQYHTLAKY